MTTSSKAKYELRVEKLFKEAWYDVMPPMLRLYALEFPHANTALNAMAEESNFGRLDLSTLSDLRPVLIVNWKINAQKVLDFFMAREAIKTALQLEATPSFYQYNVSIKLTQRNVELLFAGTKYVNRLVQLLVEFDEDEDAY